MRASRARQSAACAVSCFGAVLALLATSSCKKPVDAANGRELFATACARCHGPEGRGGLPTFDGGPSPRNFHDREFQSSRSTDQIRQTIVNGKGIAMPPFGTTFTDTQLDSLVAYVRSCDPEWK